MKLFIALGINLNFGLLVSFAAMAELADALDSGSSRGNSVDVQIILAAKL